MSNFNRRDFLKASAGVAAGTAAAGVGGEALAQAKGAPALNLKPEKGAKLRVLKWKRFVQGDEDLFNANIKKFSAQTGVEVRIDYEGFEDVRPKAAVAANVGSGPDEGALPRGRLAHLRLLRRPPPVPGQAA